MPQSLDEWIEEYRLAWENMDADAAAALFTPDATYRDNIFEDPHRGQEGVRGDDEVRRGGDNLARVPPVGLR
jgi:ketosteroid isomerase-like protein